MSTLKKLVWGGAICALTGLLVANWTLWRNLKSVEELDRGGSSSAQSSAQVPMEIVPAVSGEMKKDAGPYSVAEKAGASATISAEASAAPLDSESASNPRNRPVRRTSAPVSPEEKLLQDKRAIAEAEGSIDKKFADYLRQARLSPDNTKLLRETLARRQYALSEAMKTVRQEGLGMEDRWNKVFATAEPIEREIQLLLGPAYPDFKAYEKTLGVRTLVRQLSDALEGSGVGPLSTEKSDALVKVIVDRQNLRSQQIQYRLSLIVNDGVPPQIMPRDLRSAATILNERELKAFTELMDQAAKGAGAAAQVRGFSSR